MSKEEYIEFDQSPDYSGRDKGNKSLSPVRGFFKKAALILILAGLLYLLIMLLQTDV